jgi:hypothetical protein
MYQQPPDAANMGGAPGSEPEGSQDTPQGDDVVDGEFKPTE